MLNVLKEHCSFSGKTIFCEHNSVSTQTKMNFSAYLPSSIGEIDSAIIWLSGLTCNEENFITKAGAQAHLAGTKTMIICPDTSPRGLGLDGEDDSYDFGTGAGFYVNATESVYSSNYKMYDYITKDIVNLLKDHFGVQKISISGHSMGGHGALVLGLKNPELFTSISAFSPIVNPMVCDWGKKAFQGYLGDNTSLWKSYDACELLKNGARSVNPILIDQGRADEFLKDQLLTDNFINESRAVNQSVTLNYREGYDHSYFFIASFLKDHIDFHLKYLS